MAMDLTLEEDNAIREIVINGHGSIAAVSVSPRMIDALVAKGMLAGKLGGYLATNVARKYVMEHR